MPNLFSGPKLVVLNNAKSQLLIPAPRSVASTRDSSPNDQSSGAVKQFGLNQAIPPFDSVTCAVPFPHPATTFGRSWKFCEKPAFDRDVDPPKLIGRGKPF